MNRNEIITSINDLFDENMELKFKTKEQGEYYENLYVKDNDEKIIYKMEVMQQKIYDIGLEHLFKEGFNPYYSMQNYGSDKYYSFEEWINKSIDLNNFNDITKNEFIKLFGEKMNKEYEVRLQKAKDKEGE